MDALLLMTDRKIQLDLSYDDGMMDLLNNKRGYFMKIDDLTIGQARELAAMFSQPVITSGVTGCDSLNSMIGKKVIVRTYSDGLFFGVLAEKTGNEVIVNNARRMQQWKAAESISLSGCAIYGIDQKNSRIAPALDSIWLKAIEIIPCTDAAIKSIEEADDVKAQ